MGLICKLIFGGVSSDSLGVTVEGFPASVIPERETETEMIPGRSGALLYDHGTYKNYPQNFTLHWLKQGNVDASVAAWLHKRGYQRLEDSFHPDHFRLAFYTGDTEIENRLNVLGRAEIQFNCKPQYFRKSGEVKLTPSNGDFISNSGQTALPLITIYGTGSGAIVVGNVSAAISDIPSDGMVLDCDLQDAYSPSKLENYNARVEISGGDFPVLPPGGAQISWSGGITSVEIVPRWWDLA